MKTKLQAIIMTCSILATFYVQAQDSSGEVDNTSTEEVVVSDEDSEDIEDERMRLGSRYFDIGARHISLLSDNDNDGDLDPTILTGLALNLIDYNNYDSFEASFGASHQVNALGRVLYTFGAGGSMELLSPAAPVAVIVDEHNIPSLVFNVQLKLYGVGRHSLLFADDGNAYRTTFFGIAPEAAISLTGALGGALAGPNASNKILAAVLHIRPILGYGRDAIHETTGYAVGAGQISLETFLIVKLASGAQVTNVLNSHVNINFQDDVNMNSSLAGVTYAFRYDSRPIRSGNTRIYTLLGAGLEYQTPASNSLIQSPRLNLNLFGGVGVRYSAREGRINQRRNSRRAARTGAERRQERRAN